MPIKSFNRVPSSIVPSNPKARLLSQVRMEIHHFSYFKSDQRWDHPGKLLPCSAIYLVIDGDGWIIDSRRRSRLEHGCAYLLPPNTPLSVRCDSLIEKYWGWLSVELFPGLDLFEGVDGFVELGPFSLCETSAEFASRLSLQNANDYFRLEGLLFSLIANADLDLDVLIARQTRNFECYQKMLDHIHGNLRFGLKIETLASLLNLTPSSLSRAFKRDMGVTLKSHINSRLNRQACALLAGTSMKVKSVAASLGFDDEYYFIRFFTRQNGVSPSKYRLSFSSKDCPAHAR